MDLLVWYTVVAAQVAWAAPTREEAAPLVIAVPYSYNLLLDGAVGPAEYGEGLQVNFTDGTNPGLMWKCCGQEGTTVPSDEDLSVTFFAAFDEHLLFMAFRVSDDIPRAEEGNDAWENDGVEIFFNSDHVSNDFVRYKRPFGGW